MVADPSRADWARAVATQIQGGGAAAGPPARAPGLLQGRRGCLLAAAAVALAALAAYANSFAVPFLLDDSAAIATNPSVRSLGRALSPPPGTPVSGRPLLNLSFAANYALGRQQPWGYHALNLLIHVSAGLALLGIVRRTLTLRVLAGRYGRDGPLLALLAALLWTVHPLQTEAVTYVSQRAESLAGLLCLLALYLFVAADASASARWWRLGSVLACLMGALTKEVIATAPLLLLLYDRTFLAGSLRAALRLRWRYYLAAAASTWIPLALLARGHGSRGVGFGLGIGPWDYALTSCRSLATYIGLAFWPHPLVFDYGMDAVRSPAEVWPQGLLVVALLAAGAFALWRRPAAGFLFAWFFIVLAPTTSFIPVAAQPMAEHRAYLALAAAACAAVLVLHRVLGRWCALPLVAAVLLLACITHLRNGDYRSEEAIWTDTLARRPGNVRAHCAYGFVLSQRPGGLPRAIEQYEAAVRLDPGYVDAHNKLGIALAQTPGRLPEAIAQFEEALRLDPRFVRAHDSLGAALAGIPGRLPDAVSEFEEALRIDPGYAPAHNDLGLALAGQPGRLGEAIAQFEEAIRIDPDFPQAHNALGVALAGVPGRLPDAISQYGKALAIDPGYSDARTNLGIALARSPGGLAQAISEYRAVISADPGFAPAHNALGVALAAASGRAADGIREYEAALRARPGYPGRLDEAIGHFEAAVRLKPDYVEARNNLGLALSQAPGRLPQAVSEFEAALRLSPANAELHNNLGIALAGTPGLLSEAVAHFEEALRIRPGYPDAFRNLELARQMLGRPAGGR
jgi:tetratricopeptide (TPR) repeat protein